MKMAVKQTIKEKIRQRRAQVTVHSCIYYALNDSIIDDHTWQRWADELYELQNKYPEDCDVGYFDETFAKWDPSSGYDLPIRSPKIVGMAHKLIEYRDKNNKNNALLPEPDVLEYTGNLEDFM
jgi:hypothetical protein